MKKNNILAVALSAGLILCGGGYYLSNVDIAYAQENLSIDVEVPRKEAEVDGLKKVIIQKNIEISDLENQKEDYSKAKSKYKEVYADYDQYYKEVYTPAYTKNEALLDTLKDEEKKLKDSYDEWKAANDKVPADKNDPNYADLKKKANDLAWKWDAQKKKTQQAYDAYMEDFEKFAPIDDEVVAKDNAVAKEEKNLDRIEAKNKEIEDKINNLKEEINEDSEKIKNLEEEIRQLKRNRDIVREIFGEEANIVGYNYSSVETTKDSDKKEEMGITAETRAKLLEAIRQAEIKIDAVEFLKEYTPKTIAKVVDKLDKLVAEQEFLIKQAKELLAKYWA